MDVIIVGAGITGLTAAISLRRSGHRVIMYERSSMNNEVGAAINVPPNVSRFLVPLGLDPAKARFVTSKGMRFDSHTTMEAGTHHDHSLTASIFGAPLYYAHRVDLHESLKKLATDPGGAGVPAKVHLKSVVTGYDSEGPAITLADGTVVTADLVVAADGIHSSAVEAVLGHSNPPRPANHNNCCYRFLIGTTELEAHEDTRRFVQGPDSLICRAFADHERSRRLIAYPCRDYEVFNFVGICRKEKFSDKREDWHCPVDKSEVLQVFEGFHPDILAVINKATEVKRWPLLYRPPTSPWHKGRLVLAGDAAHPMLPHHGQGGAQGIEDGLAVGLVMHGVTDPSHIDERLALYEKIRRNRASSIQVLSNFGYDETAPPELAEFLNAEGQSMPKSIGDMVRLAYGHNVVERVVSTMTEFCPAWRLPQGFFPSQAAAGAADAASGDSELQNKDDCRSGTV